MFWEKNKELTGKEIQEKLDKYKEIQAKQEVIRKDYNNRINELDNYIKLLCPVINYGHPSRFIHRDEFKRHNPELYKAIVNQTNKLCEERDLEIKKLEEQE